MIITCLVAIAAILTWLAVLLAYAGVKQMEVREMVDEPNYYPPGTKPPLDDLDRIYLEQELGPGR